MIYYSEMSFLIQIIMIYHFFILKIFFYKEVFSMPRYPRNSIKTSYLHVMTQGIEKSRIFTKDEDIKYYIKIMYELNKEYDIEIVAYCIMNTHAHILVKVNSIDSISKYMQRLNTKYGKYYNKKYNRVGFVFRNRYKSEGIYSEGHLYNCIKYIYDNPVKAGICSHASEYLYSNYKKYNKIFENNKYVFIETDEDREKECEMFIKQYIEEKGIDTNENLKSLIIFLKDNFNVSYRKMSKYLNINRHLLRKIYSE